MVTHFYSTIIVYVLSSLIFLKKVKISIGLKKDMSESLQKDHTLECKL